MSEHDGLKVGIAFEAVRQCHQDVGRFIADLDGHMARRQWSRLWSQDAVTWGVSRAAYASHWMAERIYRMYQNEETDPGIVEGINIRFFADDGSLKEPRIVVGRARYIAPTNKLLGDVAQTWDLDEGYAMWCNAQAEDTGKILSCGNEGRGIKRMLVTGLNLYSIGRLADVTDKLEAIRQQFEAHND